MPVGLQHTFLPLALPSLLQCTRPFLHQQSTHHTRSLPARLPPQTRARTHCKDSAGLFCSVQRPFLAGPFVLYYSAPSLAFVSVLSVSVHQANFGKWECSDTHPPTPCGSSDGIKRSQIYAWLSGGGYLLTSTRADPGHNYSPLKSEWGNPTSRFPYSAVDSLKTGNDDTIHKGRDTGPHSQHEGSGSSH